MPETNGFSHQHEDSLSQPEGTQNPTPSVVVSPPPGTPPRSVRFNVPPTPPTPLSS
ncbi:hypothetical protein DACRYDRAFT_22882, partial [Dacryopinax primogenitus]